MAAVTYDGVDKVYPDGTHAVRDLSLEVADGEFLVLVGPSGCGKTSALRMLAGLEEVSAGRILIGERDVTRVPPGDRDVAMVFQNYALYPHMKVADNIAFALRRRGLPKAEIEQRVRRIARVLHLEEVLDRRPARLSGGQRQRVALGRALVREASVYLMDEPLSNLDAKLRVHMRAEIGRIQRSFGTTTIYVTHDQVEAMTMGDRVAVMRKGELQQLDTPQALYERPANLFVAAFVGSPPMNLLEAEVVAGDDGETALRVGEATFAAGPLSERVVGLDGQRGRRVALGLRPESLSEPSDGVSGPRLHGRVVLVEPLGSEVIAHVELAATRVDSEAVREGSEAVADLAAAADGERTTVVVARLPRRTRVGEGERVELVADLSEAHLFDLASGRALSHAEPALAAR